MRSFICSAIAVVALAAPVLAEDGRGWTFSGRFQGSANSAGWVTKGDPTLGYNFTRHFQAYAGLPFYFVKDSAATQTTTTGMVNGIGNAYVGLRLGVENSAVNFSSNLEATAPTGNKTDGFSTGRVTVDWTNRFSHSFSGITPFASVGLANTVSDTSFFVRPFTSLGLVSHFDGGAQFGLSHFIDIGGSAYGLKAAGQQTILSKVFKTAESGFKNRGQFIAALHVSKNLTIPFDQLKAKMTGVTMVNGQHTTSTPVSLGKAIHELRPDMPQGQADDQAKIADKQAVETVKTSQSTSN